MVSPSLNTFYAFALNIFICSHSFRFWFDVSAFKHEKLTILQVCLWSWLLCKFDRKLRHLFHQDAHLLDSSRLCVYYRHLCNYGTPARWFMPVSLFCQPSLNVSTVCFNSEPDNFGVRLYFSLVHSTYAESRIPCWERDSHWWCVKKKRPSDVGK